MRVAQRVAVSLSKILIIWRRQAAIPEIACYPVCGTLSVNVIERHIVMVKTSTQRDVCYQRREEASADPRQDFEAIAESLAINFSVGGGEQRLPIVRSPIRPASLFLNLAADGFPNNSQQMIGCATSFKLKTLLTELNINVDMHSVVQN